MAARSITMKALKARVNARLRRAALRMSVLVALPQRLSLVALLLVLSSPAGAAPVKGEVAVSTAGGYARFVFTLSEDTDADVRLNNGILIVAFKTPVEIAVDNIPLAAAAYVGAARRDPDGQGVRLALNRKVTVNTMAAGEKLFVDLLPEGWSGLPPACRRRWSRTSRGALAMRRRTRGRNCSAHSSGHYRQCACASECSRHSHATPFPCRR